MEHVFCSGRNVAALGLAAFAGQLQSPRKESSEAPEPVAGTVKVIEEGPPQTIDNFFFYV